MLRATLGVLGGLVAWVLIATTGDLVLRLAWPGYSEVEAAMAFTTAMMLARLVLGALASLGAGLVAAWTTKGGGRAIVVLAGVLLAAFIPAHYGLWEKFPVWYHVAFLLSLVVMPVLGGVLFRSWADRRSDAKHRLFGAPAK